MNETGFQIKTVSKVFEGTRALFELNVEILAGRHTAILGPSGCGKSTLLRLIAGLESPTEGQIFLNGKCLSSPGKMLVPPHQRELSMVFQDLALWPNLTVSENIRFGLKITPLERLKEALELCQISHLADRMPGQLSGGEQQRVALARALASRPQFLLLDEPFGSLDILTKSKILDELQKLIHKTDTTLVLVTHDPLEAIRVCSYAVVLENGVLQEDGKIPEIFAQPKSQILKAFKQIVERTHS